MKQVRLVLLTLLVGSVLAACGSTTSLESPIMLRVGSTTITESEFSQLLEQQAQGVMQQGVPAEQARQLLFDNLVQEEVFLNEARRAGIGVDAEMDQQIEAIISNNVQSGGKVPTYADYDALAKSLNFDSIRDIRTFLIDRLTLERYAQQVDGPSGEVQARHILLLVDQGADEATWQAAKQQADELVQRLRNGDDFAALAQQYSQDPGSAANGGDLGWQPADAYVPTFAEAVRTLPLNTISDPVRTDFGWHIIEVTGRRAFGGWQAMQQSPEGQQIIQDTLQRYRDNNELQVLIQPDTIPLPPTVNN